MEGYKGYIYEKCLPGFKAKIVTIQKYCKSGKLLDVGCAKGFFVKVALDSGFDAYGMDFSAYAVREAQKLVGDRVEKVDLEEDVALPEGQFDVVTGWDFVEHLKNPEGFLKKVNKLLRPNGYLFLTTLNHDSLMARLMSSNWRLRATFHISDYITPKLLRQWLRNAGFQPLVLSTFFLALKPFPEKLKPLQRCLNMVVMVGTPLLKATGLGDCLLCVARKC